MNPADKLQEIADKISELANALTIIQEEFAEAIVEIREKLAQTPPTQEELSQAVDWFRERLQQLSQNPPGPPSSRPKLPKS